MKRPQFSLKLTLLVITLLATIFAWRKAVYQKWRLDNPRIQRLDANLRYYEKQRDFLIDNGYDTANGIDAKARKIREELDVIDR
jgi:hypothetical protein